MPTESEEIVKLETQIGHLLTGFNDLRQEIKEWKADTEGKFVPRKEIEQMFIMRDKEIEILREENRNNARKSDFEEMKSDIKEIKEDKKSNRPLVAAWVSVAVSCVMVVVTIFAIYLHK